LNYNPPVLQHRYGSRIFDYSKRTYLMGVLNVTPDSFSDGGAYPDANAAIEYALEMMEEGADMIDIGGESTRPGSNRISAREEADRVLPVVEGILRHNGDAILSIDTYKAEVASEALEQGACIVNDISALRFDDKMGMVIRKHDASVILMHMKGKPRTMQENPSYDELIGEIKTFLQDRIDVARRLAITQIIVDPGIGFGKRLPDNLEILKSLRRFAELGCPVLIGTSRKSFIGKILDTPVDQRLGGSIASAVIGVLNGASLVRVHDIKETKRAIQIVDAILQGSRYIERKTGIV
jgi:dihydropteroate synthase